MQIDFQADLVLFSFAHFIAWDITQCLCQTAQQKSLRNGDYFNTDTSDLTHRENFRLLLLGTLQDK